MARYEEDQLRAYQMSRLRYYYAIIECDNAATGRPFLLAGSQSESILVFSSRGVLPFLFPDAPLLSLLSWPSVSCKAAGIYNQCDGTEYERSSNVLDFRYVPDEVVFDETPTDVAEDLPDAEEFQPKEYVLSPFFFGGEGVLRNAPLPVSLCTFSFSAGHLFLNQLPDGCTPTLHRQADVGRRRRAQNKADKAQIYGR